MNVKWKIAYPDDFFKEMKASKFKIDQGIIKPRSFEGIMWLYILEDLVCFEGEIDKADKKIAIHESLTKCINMKFDSAFFLEELIKNIKSVQKKHIKQKILLASISIGFPEDLKEIDQFGSKINFYRENYPQQYYLLNPCLKNATLPAEEHYTKITISRYSYSNEIASLLRELNIFRALLCVQSNHYMVMGDNYYEPINLIKLGKNYSLYDERKLIEYGSESPYKSFPQKAKYVERHIDSVVNMIETIDNIQNENYRNTIKESLLIFVNALDDYDANAALALLWNSLDKLSNSSKGNYEQVLKRVASIGINYSYDRVVLENIKNMRNEYVHQGIENSKAKIFCYQLQSYYIKLLKFHLCNSSEFGNIQEANDFLSYISQSNELKGDNKNYLLVKRVLPHQKGLAFRTKPRKER